MKLKKFQSSSGQEILVGQDDLSNDELTLRVAHANDVWLHVSGAPGSHVVLRCGEQGIRPDKTSLREAAALAAWFSKLRHGGKVPVHYCRAQDVSKPRDAKPGTVTLKRFEKVIVRPGIPCNELTTD